MCWILTLVVFMHIKATQLGYLTIKKVFGLKFPNLSLGQIVPKSFDSKKLKLSLHVKF